MPRAPEFLLPRRRQGTWWAVAISVAFHLVLLSVRSSDWFWTLGEPPEVTYVPLVADIPAYQTEPTPPRPRRSAPAPPVPAPEPPLARGGVAPAEVAAAEVAGVSAAPVDSAAGQPSPAGRGPVSVPRLRPALGEGKLWVQPLPLAPRDLAQRLTRSHFELVDSAVSAIVQAYLDSLVAAPTPFDNKPPSWVTKVGGKTFGLDSRNIYIGGLKIPTAILALLPIPEVSSVDLRYSQRMADIRSDLQYAAARAATMEDFKRAVREIRERRERERAFERNQRRAPADTSRAP